MIYIHGEPFWVEIKLIQSAVPWKLKELQQAAGECNFELWAKNWENEMTQERWQVFPAKSGCFTMFVKSYKYLKTSARPAPLLIISVAALRA